MLTLKGQRLFCLETCDIFFMSLTLWYQSYLSEGDNGWVFHLLR